MTATIHPSNLTIGQRVFFHIDNSDFREDSGIQTHILLAVGFQDILVNHNVAHAEKWSYVAPTYAHVTIHVKIQIHH